MSSINLELGFTAQYTLVPNIFIDNHMPNAPHAYSLIYLYLLRNGFDQNFKLDTKKISEKFHIIESDIMSAFNFWHEKQIIDYSNEHGIIKLRLLDIHPDNLINLNEKKEANIEKQDPKQSTKPELTNLKVLENAPSVGIKPNYSNEEIMFSLEKSKEIRSLLTFTENKFGRLLRPSEIQYIYALVDWLRMPIPLAEKLVNYCTSINKRNVQYMESVAITWFENGIKTVEDAETFLENSTFYTKVLKEFGIYGRFVSTLERDYIDTWLQNYKHSEQMIIIACRRTSEVAKSNQFKYTNSILDRWHKNGIKTPADAEREEIEFKEKSKKDRQQKNSSSFKKSSKLNNFDGEDLDYEEIALLETKYLYENNMKGLS